MQVKQSYDVTFQTNITLPHSFFPMTPNLGQNVTIETIISVTRYRLVNRICLRYQEVFKTSLKLLNFRCWYILGPQEAYTWRLLKTEVVHKSWAYIVGPDSCSYLSYNIHEHIILLKSKSTFIGKIVLN